MDAKIAKTLKVIDLIATNAVHRAFYPPTSAEIIGNLLDLEQSGNLAEYVRGARATFEAEMYLACLVENLPLVAYYREILRKTADVVADIAEHDAELEADQAIGAA